MAETWTFPEATQLVEMPTEEVGVAILLHLGKEQHARFHLSNLCNSPFVGEQAKRARIERRHLQKVFAEGWAWLESEGLLAVDPEEPSGAWRFITRKGHAVIQSSEPFRWVSSALLPKSRLHPLLARDAREAFLRGSLETAVFTAFKEVEIQVREAAGFDEHAYGVELMRRAFHHETGPLRDASLPEAERQAVSHLFAGAIGLLKNPSSHRHVVLTDPEEAAELILFANYLLRIVESAKERTAASQQP